MRILLAEDNNTSAQTILPVLVHAGLHVDVTDTGRGAIEMLRNYNYGLVIVELFLPDMDGYDFIASLRARKIQTPIVILSAIDKPHSKIKAFSIGADDYLTKPFDPEELVARVQAILRRSNGYSQPVTEVGNMALDLNQHTVSVAGVPVHRTGKEFAILELLVLRKGISLTKEALLNHLYGGHDEPDIKIIDVFVCKLRKKLQAAGAGNLISTIWGRGYVLNDSQPKKTVANRISPATHYQENRVPQLQAAGE
ncbi:response regulator transcription factor [Acetobacter tropicalis]|uniref:response regulator transcription factor n=1 Tax=Acetobacter tropicalis TaxID=104102 RepID=UPI003976A578